MIILRDYQEEAIQELCEKSRGLMELGGTKRMVFKAPTGSGKTIMMAEFLKRLQEEMTGMKPLAFIWTAPRQLHQQSKQKLENYFEESRILKCIEFEEITERKIKEGEILFFNWEHINRADNVYIRENEQDFNLSSVLDNTIDAGNEIILVIDEAHHTATSDISLGLVEMINPKLMIDVSATPEIQGDEMVVVQREDVIAEGMIKKQIGINPGFKNIIEKRIGNKIIINSDANKSKDEIVLAEAIKKREEVTRLFNEIGSIVNPLLLIQIPDRRQGDLVDYEKEIQRILQRNHNITIENGKLAIYLSENKENLENLTKNNAEAEVMIFKHAIALGWDCPRASILCLFRDWKSFRFSIQTLGRILRMPELKHYESEALNTAYIYTTLGDLTILEDTAGDYITIQYSKRKDVYEDIKLKSIHTKRKREVTRLNPRFIELFVESAKELKLYKAINLKHMTVRQAILADGEIANVDHEIIRLRDGQNGDDYHANQIEMTLQGEDIQRTFDYFARESLHPEFYPERRSVGRVKDAIYKYFYITYPGAFKKYSTEIQKIVLDEHNQQPIKNAIHLAKEKYQQELDREARELIEEKWEVMKEFNYNNNYTRQEIKKCIMDPFYEKEDAPKTEKEFAAFLDTNARVKWWFKNGDRDATFFAVPYKYHEELHSFYVDWVVMFEDGRLCLFDTKAGMTADTGETKAKAEGLQSYIAEESKKGKKLLGGIVIPDGGSWRVNNNDIYVYNKNDLSDWKFIDTL